MYKTILLAFDGSEEGARALREGALLAKACGASVVLLSVVPESGGVVMAEGVQGGVVAQLIESHKGLLERGCTRLRQLGCEPTPRLEVGEPAPTIGAVAHEVKADLVVVGHRKQNFLSRWWSGSTDAYLSDHVGCSVLVSCKAISDEEFEARLQSLEQEQAPVPAG
jgi:nucleotide-binding universal stress UspA family protein